jgi:hypothetical protein
MTRPRSAWLGALNLTQFALDVAKAGIADPFAKEQAARYGATPTHN